MLTKTTLKNMAGSAVLVDAIDDRMNKKADVAELMQLKEQLDKLKATSSFYGELLEPFIDEYISEMVDDLEKMKLKELEYLDLPGIINIDFQPPLTIVCWEDGVKTFVKALDCDKYDPEKGAAMAIAKRYFNNDYEYINIIEHFTDRFYRKNPDYVPKCCCCDKTNGKKSEPKKLGLFRRG